jgi:hypothetical protein
LELDGPTHLGIGQLFLFLVVEITVLEMLFFGLGHGLKLLLGLEVEFLDERREEEAQDHLKEQVSSIESSEMRLQAHLQVRILPRPQRPHPQIGQNDLTTRMGQQRPMIGRHRQRQATLARPRMQLARQQPLGLLRVLSVAKVQQFQTALLKLLRITPQLLVNLRIQVIIGRFMGHRLVQLTRHQRLGQRLLTMRPHQHRHLLAFGQHSPDLKGDKFRSEKKPCPLSQKRFN